MNTIRGSRSFLLL